MPGNEDSNTPGTESQALQRLYNWTLRSAGTRHAVWALVAVCFLQSLILPVPPDLLLIPMVLARRAKAWGFATISTPVINRRGSGRVCHRLLSLRIRGRTSAQPLGV